MKIALDKIFGFNKLPPALRSNPKLSLAVIFCLCVLLVFLLVTGGRQTRAIRKGLEIVDSKNTAKPSGDKDVGVLVGAVDTKSYVLRIEKQYYDISAKFDSLDERLGTLERGTQELRKNQAEVSRIVIDLDKRITDALTKSAADQMPRPGADFAEGVFAPFSVRQPVRQELNLEMARLAEIKDEEREPQERFVYLPLGSFVECTLLTGVYAPANESNPLPVLISVDEAFYGPNNTRIPLKGSFAIGKAIGDVVSKRAIIQIVSFSSVLPDGRVFEHEANLGYLADNDGHLGIPGEVIYSTGRQLSLDFLSGFLAGGAAALSQAETSTVVGGYGQTSRNVTGDSGRYAMFSGLAQSAEGMSGYYRRQLEAMMPAIRIEAGKKAVFVVQKGVQIEGLVVPFDDFDYIR